MLFHEIPYANYLMLLLATPVVFWFGRQFPAGAIKQLRHGSANMDTLVALSTGIAYIYSVIVTFFPGCFRKKGSKVMYTLKPIDHHIYPPWKNA
jgi:Cu2+-exporting ATPase